MFKLFGDGLHDDYPAIQALLDSRTSQVELPSPASHYCLSRTRKIDGGQTLRLPRTAVIRLLPGSDCLMLENAETDSCDIAIEGGIWDYANLEQTPNPFLSGAFRKAARATHRDGNPETVVTYEDIYSGVMMRFFKVTRLSIRNLTMKDPVTYCLQMAYVRYFTVENIDFDMNLGNPTPMNMDGVHLDGGCRFGTIRNVKGTCHDDMVALNADDGCDGPIEDIEIDGVFGEGSHRAIRLLSMRSLVARISVSNVFGTCYASGIMIAYWYPPTGVRGKMSRISFRNIHAEFALPPGWQEERNPRYNWPLIWIDGDLDIDFLSFDNLSRREDPSARGTIEVGAHTHIENLSLSNVFLRTAPGNEFGLLRNEGRIDQLHLYNVDEGCSQAEL
jgi:hypothetical protein